MGKWETLEDYMNKYGFEKVADHTKVRVHFRGKSVVVERCMVDKMQADLDKIAPGLLLITKKVDEDVLGNKMVLDNPEG